MKNFWKKLKKPFTVLAPMEDVTDFVFREILTEVSKPNVFFTEFVNVTGLLSEGKKFVERRLKYSERQRPIVAQIWGSEPEDYYEAAKHLESLGFDGIDINMGCPKKSVVKHKSGAALINYPELAKEIIEATKKGAPNLPISVKTRTGYDKIETTRWTTHLLKQDLSALALHGRTRKQMSKGKADWEEIKKAVEIRNEISPNTIIIGNGDVENYQEAQEKAKEYEVDGVMIGRGIFTNPWAFEKEPKEHSKKEYLNLLLKHTKLFEETWREKKNFAIMKKFFKVYVRDFECASELRKKLMKCNKYIQVENLVEEQLC